MTVPVVYVGSATRSGSTLLGMMLGQLPGFVWVGEVRWIWRQWQDDELRCGCGKPYASCPFWTSVVETAFGGWDGVDAAETIALEREVVRFRTLPLLRTARAPRSFQRKVDRYTERVTRLYEGILQVSGASTVVDTTKDPPYAFLLARAPELSLRLVHLIRDSRGVAYSLQKVVERRDTSGAPQHMLRSGPVATATVYDLYNTVFATLGALGVPRLSIRYERLIDRTREQLERVVRFAGVEDITAGWDWLGDRTMQVVPQHGVSGNPVRFSRGRIELRADEEWRRHLSVRSRAIVTALTLPYLLVYGNLFRKVEME